MKKCAWLADKAHIMAAILIIIQPIMDVVSYWMSEFGMSNTPTLLLRMGVLGIAVLYAFIVSDKKHVYLIAAAIMAVVYAGHVFACMQVGFINPVDDFSNYVRIVQMPLLVLVFITFMRKNDKSFDYIQMGASVALLFMFAIEIISTVTGTDPHTYTDGTGILGWFYNTNSQSSNLSTLAPILFVWQLNWKKRRPVLVVLTAIASCLSMYLFATRLAYLGLMAFTVGFGVMIFVVRRKEWKYGVMFLVFAIVFAALLPNSPTMRHLNISEEAQSNRQEMLDAELADKRDEINSIIEKLPEEEQTTAVPETTVAPETTVVEDTTVAPDTTVVEDTTVAPDTTVVEDTTVAPETTVVEDTTVAPETTVVEDTTVAPETTVVEDTTVAPDTTVAEDTTVEAETTEPEETASEDEKKKLIEELTPIYERYVGDFVKRFGAEKTMEMYDYTLDVRTFASIRAKKLMFAEMLMQDSPFSARLFGVEISRFYFDGTIYDVENDFHGIYFLYGGVGFAAYLLFIAYFALIVIKALIKDFKKYFTLEAVAYGISAVVCLIHCYNTAGVLRRPNASVYLSVVLAAIYYLVYIRKYEEKEPELLSGEEVDKK